MRRKATIRRCEKAYKRYQSKRWKVFREMYLAEHPLCKNFDDCHNFAEHVDHIKRIESEEDELFYDENNLQALCRKCHSKKTAMEDGGFGNRKKSLSN